MTGGLAIDRRTALGCIAGLALSACRRRIGRTIRVGSVPRLNIAPLYVADELGFFQQAGLTLDIQLLADTTQAVPLLAAGQIDVSLAGATPALFNAVAQGARTRLVAGREVALPGCSRELFGNRRSFPDGFTDARQMKGKRIAVTSPTSLTAFLLDVLLESAGLATDDIQRVTMRTAESGPALLAGQIDAVIDLDMNFSPPELVPGPAVADVIPGFLYNYVVFGKGLIDGDVATGAAFLNAYFRGAHEFRRGRMPKALDLLARGSGIDPALARSTCHDRLTENGAIDSASVQRPIDWSRKKGFLRGTITPDQLVDRRFLEAATE